jgi:hypothetical protein
MAPDKLLEQRRFLAALVLTLVGVAIAFGQPPARRPLPVPDIPGFRTLKGDSTCTRCSPTATCGRPFTCRRRGR